MKKVSKESDLLVCLALNFNPREVKNFNIKYFTHLNEETTYMVTLGNGIIEENGIYMAILPSQELTKMQEGQLCSIVTICREDSKFPDQDYNEIIKQNLDIWLN